MFVSSSAIFHIFSMFETIQNKDMNTKKAELKVYFIRENSFNFMGVIYEHNQFRLFSFSER